MCWNTRRRARPVEDHEDIISVFSVISLFFPCSYVGEYQEFSRNLNR